ncbi:helix-turn-helix domain-containing protein [Roseobacter sp. HKCCD9010]|uniref:IclR family transcriptional regulator n=2 Tax=unclassified Roseobacter TaxID=196798 RepID=UPI0014912180|nr:MULTISPECIES: helix-turn-helix domain-containing protein [unclassified Roseobacter]MBF9048819.1 helix-turn-helix domain-containing protein [Rhodobacterales bacterium HKCCD4356]NNV76040.1 helix-turn-helix domain-containing protein [Roseobacter sp. HKCCD6135]NNW05359.1 helix-turn-helix domain-containing protein [Roseobacter sp. HKCCD8431]NNW30982.1 helix-turn-helix domain-containing protein [Roseobacter sp. HKCCD8198]NNW52217.1 helix-turn-helix domain-containing protein [Roseobacter sp. HKCCD
MGAMRTESVERAMSILSAFSAQQPELRLTDLARETGLHKSTVLRIANSMSIYGFMQRTPRGRYRLGPSVWRLGQIFAQDYPSREAVAPTLQKLVKATGETASFYVRAGEDRVCLYRETAADLRPFGAEEGMRLNMSTGVSGLVLRRFSGEEVPDLSVFNDNGTVSSDAPTIPEISAVATPVFSASGTLIGALTISGLSSRFDAATRQKATPLLEDLARSMGK